MSLAYNHYKEGGLLNGRYQKIEDISEGAYGIVSLAKDKLKSNFVAVKYIFKYQEEKSPTKDSQFSKSLTSISKKVDSDICEEALHEIDIHKKLGSHPNIISLVDCFDSFIVLEYCPRGDLYEAIRSNMGPTSTTDIVNVTLQLISAAEYAHQNSIYHRDIKPENILIAEDFSIRLSDWGLASSQRLCSDFGVGSERYMAPELFDEKNVQVYDASKCDIWSIGVCLLNIVFHKSPFSAANETDKSFSYFARNREALFDIFSSMSDDLFAALRFSLTLDPENRDLQKMREELLKVQRLTFDEDFDLVGQDNSEVTEARPITIQQSKATGGVPRRYSAIGRSGKNCFPKSFAIPTPNTQITSHFQEFRKEEFNRRDFFTPPSVTAHYLEKFGAERNHRPGIYQPPHQRPSTPKLGGHLSIPNLSPAKRSRKNSFNSYSSSAGKYVPPNLRASPNIMKSPLHETAEVDDFDSDDDLFVLEEADSRAESDVDHDHLGGSIAALNIEDQAYSSELSSAPSLIVSAPLRANGNKATSNTIHNRKPQESVHNKAMASTDQDSLSSDSNSEPNTKRVYVPPHHRGNYHSHFNNNTHNKKPSFWNHQHQNGAGYQRGRRMSAHKKHAISSSVPATKTDWFPPSRVDVYEDDFGDDEDFEKSEFYKNFASRVGEHTQTVLPAQADGKARMIRETIREVGPVAVDDSD